MSYCYSDYDNLKAENSALQRRLECLNSKMCELESKYNTATNELLSCQEQNDKYHENDARLSTLVDLSRQQLMEKTISLDSMGQEINKLLSERDECKGQAKIAYQSITAYTSEINDLRAGKDDLERRFYHVDNSVRSFFKQMGDMLGDNDITFEKIYEIFKLNITKESNMKARLDSFGESIETAELESRAARETIQRLASEVTAEQQLNMKNKNILNEKNSEITRLQAECSALAGENRDLCGRLDCEKNDKYNLSRVLTEKTNQLESMSADYREVKQSLDMTTQDFNVFQCKVGEMVYNVVPDKFNNYSKVAFEAGNIIESLKSRINEIDSLEYKIRKISKESDDRDSQTREYFQQLEQSKKMEAQMAADIRQLRDLLASNEIIIEGLRESKQNHMRFLEDLVHNLKLPSFIEGLSTESVALTRAQQLVSMETEAMATKNSQVHLLQRKTKAMKEQIDNKDLHNTMLRKKIVQLEEEITSKSQLQNARDDQILRSQKLHKMNDKLNEELVSAKKEIQQLKAEQCDFSKREKFIIKEDTNKINYLENSINSLQETIDKQTFKINRLKEQKLKREAIINETNPRVETMESHIDGLTQSLEECRGREKQLLDLRETVGRLLSLEISTLAVPDYEIISRLESLINSSKVIATNYMFDEEPEQVNDRPQLVSVTQKPRKQIKTTKINKKLNIKVDPTKY